MRARVKRFVKTFFLNAVFARRDTLARPKTALFRGAGVAWAPAAVRRGVGALVQAAPAAPRWACSRGQRRVKVLP